MTEQVGSFRISRHGRSGVWSLCMMNRLLVLLFLCAVASAQEKSQNLHDFGLWGVYMKDASLGVALKATFIAGFTNGLFAGGSVIGGSAAPENKFLACVRTMSQEQI